MPNKTSKTEQGRPAALAGLTALRETLAENNPPFKVALSAEEDAEAFCSNLRKELRSKRKSLGIDQEKMGSRLNLSQSAISKIESGRGDIGMKTLHRYARALGLRPVLGYVPTLEAMEALIKETIPSGVLEPAMTAVEVGSAVAAAMLSAAFDVQVDAQKALMRRVYQTINQITEEKVKEPA